MPLAKTAEVETPQPEVKVSSPTEMQFDGIPMDFYRVFNVELSTLPAKEIDKLKSIYEWSKEGSESVGDMMQKVSKLERELGSPALNEKRYDKMFRWVKMNKAINELRKQQESLGVRKWL